MTSVTCSHCVIRTAYGFPPLLLALLRVTDNSVLTALLSPPPPTIPLSFRNHKEFLHYDSNIPSSSYCIHNCGISCGFSTCSHWVYSNPVAYVVFNRKCSLQRKRKLHDNDTSDDGWIKGEGRKGGGK
ncbi:unnamed protein product [Lepeophtheirus salmonis]|uniref:(salmon louse) hypothetical protein n=1 Tax=Lepeophtheirus salmonis TaxID=72036 RepID=A0A7R8CXL0_LEPSM|nr:unnamed protein product [Lepeophtheirus salmonis]CAF2961348.1 unnamed protein product [Lepeophtheirus salmonis]